MKLLRFFPVLLIYLFGLINIIGIRSDLIVRHIIFFLIGLGLFYMIKRINIHFFRSNATFFYWVTIVLLIITYIIGFEVKGSTRWIDLYFFQLQPSEVFKVFFIIFLANLFASHKPHLSPLKLFFVSIFYTIIPFVLIARQPDLGSALIILAIYIVMVVHSPIKKRYLFYFALLIVCLLPLIWFTLHDYQRHRIISFVHPTDTTASTSYNMTQAIITVGSGNLTGRGLGMGKQSQLYFLPEYHTDFAFSSFIEQFGFVGGVILIILYMVFFAILFNKLIRIISKRDDVTQFEFYYTLGFSAFVIAQTCINIGMNVGVLPIAGITLPFVSYGGSSLMTLMIGLALLP